MPYEIDFIGLSKETKDAAAICMRWKNWDDSYTVGVFDGGFTEYSEQLKRLWINTTLAALREAILTLSSARIHIRTMCLG